jgi:putative heme-binding domain-containing protein
MRRKHRTRLGIRGIGIGLALAAALGAPPAGAQHEGKDAPKKHPFMTDLKAIAAGGQIFATSCAVCHGTNGLGGRGPNLVQRFSWHPLDDETLFKTIKSGVPAAGMPPSRLGDDDLWRLSAYVRSLTLSAAQAEVPGDPRAGETLYWGKAGCSGCHQIRGRGGQLGPDLTNVGALRPLALIRESVLDPDADGLRNYRGVRVVRRDGSTVEGVARNRSNYSLQVQDASGKVYLIAMSDVRELDLSAHSPMPRDYGKRLSAREIEDLLAYLSRQSIRPPEPLGTPETK